MKLSLTSVLFALALPLGAQEPVVSESESIFYKAFWLERKSPPDPAGAMVLYEQFLTKAPESAHAAEAAERQYRLLDRTGKTKERDAFRAKYEKLLAGVTPRWPARMIRAQRSACHMKSAWSSPRCQPSTGTTSRNGSSAPCARRRSK
jgi:hypothetical protein